MNKLSFLVGLVMLAAAVVFVYVEEPAVVRIVCGAAFFICVVVLYFTITSKAEKTEDTSLQVQTEKPRGKKSVETLQLSLDEASKSKTQKNNNEINDLNSGLIGSETHPLLPYQRKEIAIPEHYYKDGDHRVPEDPRGEFDYLIQKLLVVLKDLLIAHTVGLFWINNDRKQIVIGEYVSDSKQFTTTRRVPLSNDLLSQISNSGRPEIVSDIPTSSEQDLLIYYDARQNIRSFVGVPVYFMNEPIAVLAADSKASDIFGIETVSTIGHFTLLIAILLRSYNQKYDLDADAKLLATIDRMRKTIQSNFDTHGIVIAATNAVTESVDWDYIAFVNFDMKKQSWIVAKSQTKSASSPYIAEGTIVDIEKSLVGRTLLKLKPSIYPSPTSPDFRFINNETIESKGHLCLVPLNTSNRCYGMIVVEYREKHQYGERDIEILQRISQIVSLFYEVQSLSELTRTQLLVDETTRVGSRSLLLRRLQEERARCISLGGDVTFFLVAIDRPEEIGEKHSQHGSDALLVQIGKTLQSLVKPFDVVARYDAYKFGIILINTGAEDAYLQGEKIRKAVASTIVTVDGTSFSTTVSVGGCLLSGTIEPAQVLKTIQQVVERAATEGGNIVKIV